jgi:hypothetical protein
MRHPQLGAAISAWCRAARRQLLRGIPCFFLHHSHSVSLISLQLVGDFAASWGDMTAHGPECIGDRTHRDGRTTLATHP